MSTSTIPEKYLGVDRLPESAGEVRVLHRIKPERVSGRGRVRSG